LLHVPHADQTSSVERTEGPVKVDCLRELRPDPLLAQEISLSLGPHSFLKFLFIGSVAISGVIVLGQDNDFPVGGQASPCMFLTKPARSGRTPLGDG